MALFGKFMNNYFYGKAGKGDYTKEDLPTTRLQLFGEMFRIRLSSLFRLNLMTVAIWIPTMVVVMMMAISAITVLNSVNDGQVGETVIIENTQQGGESTEITYISSAQAAGHLQGLLQYTLLLLIPCIAITGPVTAGVAYVTRNWSRDEHAFIWSDFKDAVKVNWKQGLIVSVITGLLPYLLYTCWNFYGSMAGDSVFMVVPQVLTVFIGIMWFLSLTYMYPLMVTYTLTFRQLIRNSFLLAVGRLPMSVGLRLLYCVPSVLAAVSVVYVHPVYPILVLGAYYIFFGYSFSRFISASYTNAVFDRYINPQIEGAEVGRGLAKDEDDEDDEDEEETLPGQE